MVAEALLRPMWMWAELLGVMMVALFLLLATELVWMLAKLLAVLMLLAP